jgi:hypothetical protein
MSSYSWLFWVGHQSIYQKSQLSFTYILYLLYLCCRLFLQWYNLWSLSAFVYIFFNGFLLAEL